MSRRGKKTQPLPVGQPTLDEHNYRTGVRMAEKHLTNNLVISIIDECFKNGPVDLTEETSWTLIQKVIEQHCQVFEIKLIALFHHILFGIKCNCFEICDSFRTGILELKI